LAWKVAKANATQHDRHTWDYTKNICKHSLMQLTPPLYDFMKKHYKRIRGKPFDSHIMPNRMVPNRLYLPWSHRKQHLWAQALSR